MPIFNNPVLGQAFGNIRDMFAPPGGSDMAGYASAAAKKAETDKLNWLFNNPDDPKAATVAALLGVQNYGATAEGFNKTDATNRRGQDLTFDASRLNNADDNARALTTNAADNKTKAITSFYQPLNQGQIRSAVPDDIAQAIGLPAMPETTGAAKPLSETEWQAGQNERLRLANKITDQDLIDAIYGDKAPVKAVGPDGKTSVFMTPGAAVRQNAQPAQDSPSTVVNMGSDAEYGKPEEGLAWVRGADGKVKLDERGAPIAIPYQGSKAYLADQKAKSAGDAKDASAYTKNNIVLQDIGRAMESVKNNPMLTTGVGAQLTSNIGGTPAMNLASLLDTVGANVGFEQLQQMRDSSPTGGALGQVSEKETALLQSVLGSIKQSQSPDQLQYNLKRLKNTYLDIIEGPNGPTPRETLANPTQATAPSASRAAAAQPAMPGAPTAGDILDGYRFKGGNPADQNSWEKM